MSTATLHGRPFTGLTITEVTRITGLERTDIYRARELAGCGVPGDFGYPHAQEVYTPQGVAKIAEALPQLGKDDAAKLLRSVLAQVREPQRSPVLGFGWLDRHERQQEASA